MIDWDTLEAADVTVIRDIAKRAVSAGLANDVMAATMDLQACHTCGNPLDLAGLLAAKPGDFAHDITGINAHLDHDTGELGECFRLRFSA